MSNQSNNGQQEVNVTELQKELDTLKASYVDLEGRYNQLDTTHNEYKFDTEFQRDMQSISNNINESELNVLKQLKRKGDLEAYNLLKNKYSDETTYTGSNGEVVKYVPGSGSVSTVNSEGNLFEYERSKMKEGN